MNDTANAPVSIATDPAAVDDNDASEKEKFEESPVEDADDGLAKDESADDTAKEEEVVEEVVEEEEEEPSSNTNPDLEKQNAKFGFNDPEKNR